DDTASHVSTPTSPPRIRLHESVHSSARRGSSPRSPQLEAIPLSGSIVHHENPFLPVERAAKALQRTIQSYLDAQSEGLNASLTGTGQDDLSSVGSLTPTPSVTTPTRDNKTPRTIPVRQPKLRKTSLRGARRGLGTAMEDFARLKEEELSIIDSESASRQSALKKARGFQDGNMAGMMISLTAVREWANDTELKERVTQECLSGKKFMCLAVTEAFAGSDVAGLRTTAEMTPDGKHYIINGTKKWITNGMFADYFVTGCRTKKGFSVILIPRDDNVETQRIKTSYSTAAATTFIQFDNVKVPVNHLLGKEDQGFIVIMSNFNHERWAMACSVIRWCRTITEECLKWCHQRIVFGKPLISQPVMRQKLARMISLTEACQSWLETITFQMNNMSYAQQSKLLGGPIGLLKSFATRAAHEVADDAVNIFGGRGITQTGMGRYVEMFHRTYKFDAILGGTEEILADLGVRQAMKQMPKAML
ncbi:MAG: hypothetical protein M1823_006391, partial [Watsoniomyces obsoletus]